MTDVANFWLLYTINTYLPRFRHVFETRRGHPGELYEAMVEVAGALTTFSTDIHPRGIPAYDHARLGECFTKLDSLVRQLLETVVPVNFVALPLREVDSAIYATAIEQERWLSAPQFFLAVRAGMKPADLVKKVPQLLKVSSNERLPGLIRHALPGVALRHVPHPPSAVPVKLESQYFELDKSGDEWSFIARARNLASYVPADFPAPELELIIVLPRE